MRIWLIIDIKWLHIYSFLWKQGKCFVNTSIVKSYPTCVNFPQCFSLFQLLPSSNHFHLPFSPGLMKNNWKAQSFRKLAATKSSYIVTFGNHSYSALSSFQSLVRPSLHSEKLKGISNKDQAQSYDIRKPNNDSLNQLVLLRHQEECLRVIHQSKPDALIYAVVCPFARNFVMRKNQGRSQWGSWEAERPPPRRSFVGNFVPSSGFLGFECLHLEDLEEKGRRKA